MQVRRFRRIIHVLVSGGLRDCRPDTPSAAGVQDDALVAGGEAFGAAQPEGLPGGPVEQGEVVVGVGGYPDDIRHRQQGAAGGDGVAGLVLQFLQGRRDDDRRR